VISRLELTQNLTDFSHGGISNGLISRLEESDRRTSKLLLEVLRQQTLLDLIDSGRGRSSQFGQSDPDQYSACNVVSLNPRFAALTLLDPGDLLEFSVKLLNLPANGTHFLCIICRMLRLNRHEIKTLLDGLEMIGTAPTLRLAVRFLLLTGVRKGEFIGATWAEVDWERAQWLIPAERMKAGKPHTVYLAEQALDTRPLRQTSCRLDINKNLGAAMKEDRGSIRTSIQRQSGGKAVAAADHGIDRFRVRCI
jgi:hypothetical protein